MLNRARIALCIVVALTTTVATGCAGRRTPVPQPDPTHRVTVNGRAMESNEHSLLRLLLGDPTMRHFVEGAAHAEALVLVMVDGVVMPSTAGLDNIRVFEVERVQLLGGAQATIRYGSRAAGGAIIVETRFRRPPDLPPPFAMTMSGSQERTNASAASFGECVSMMRVSSDSSGNRLSSAASGADLHCSSRSASANR